MTLNLSGLKPLEPQLNLSGLRPLEAPAPVPEGQTPFFDQGYFEQLGQLENRPLWEMPDDAPVFPNQAPELQGGMDFGFGHKLTPQEIASGLIHGIPFSGAKVADAKEILKHDLATQWQGTYKALGEDFRHLPLGAQILLTDYNFTGVLDKFPKFTDAIMKGDYDTAEKEYVRYMTDQEGNKVPLGTRNTFAFKKLQELRGLNQPELDITGLQAMDSSPLLPAESSASVEVASSSPGADISEGGDSFFDKWIEKIVGNYEKAKEKGETTHFAIPMAEFLATMGTGTLSFIGGYTAGVGAGLIPGGGTVKNRIAKANDIARGFAEEYTYMPRGEGSTKALEPVMKFFEYPYEKSRESILAAGGTEEDVKVGNFALDTAFLILPSMVKRAWVNGKLSIRQERQIKKAFEEHKAIIEEIKSALPEGVDPNKITKGMDEALKGMKEQRKLRRTAPRAKPLIVEPTYIDRGIESGVGGRRASEVTGRHQEILEGLKPESERKPMPGGLVERDQNLWGGIAEELRNAVRDQRDIVTESKLPEVSRDIVGSQMMPERTRQRLERAEGWLRITELQKQRLRERQVQEWSGVKEPPIEEVNPYDFLERLEQLEEIKGPSTAELATMEDIIRREQKIFEAGLEPTVGPKEKAAIFMKMREERAKVAENATLQNGTKQTADLGPAIKRKNINEDGTAWFQGGKVEMTDAQLVKSIKNVEERHYGLNWAREMLEKAKKLPDDADVTTVRREVGLPDSRLLTKKDALERYGAQIADSEQYIADLRLANEVHNQKRGKQPKAPIKPEDLGVSDRRNGIFPDEQTAREYAEANGYEGEIIVDPDSGRAFLDPDLMRSEDIVWDDPSTWDAVEEIFYGDEPDGPDVRLSDEATGDLVDLINNERGAVTIEGPKERVVEIPAMTGKQAALDRTLIQQVKKLRAEADKIKKPLDESLRSMGMSEEIIAGVLEVEKRIPDIEARLRAADPIVEAIFNPEGERLYQTFRGHGTGKNRVRVAKPFMTQPLKDILLRARKLIDPKDRGNLTKLMDAFEIRINAFARVSPEIKKVVYDNWLAKYADYKREYRRFRRDLKKDIKMMSNSERERISLFAHSMQEGGIEILEGMGFKGRIPKFKDLTPFEQSMYKKYSRILEDTWFRIDHMRSNTGLRPIGKLDNYFPFIHKLREMNRGGVLQDLASVEMKQFTGKSKQFKEKYFLYSKKRGKSVDPIELDIFDLTRDYMDKALKGIHVNPVAALAKEMANLYVKGDKAKGIKGYRWEDRNPAAAKLLRDFADEIVGLDPVMAAMHEKIQGAANIMNLINKNLTIATLFGTASTAMKQPLALIGVMSETNPMYMIEGIMKSAVDDPTKLRGTSKARAKSKVLEARQMDIFMDNFASDIQKGKIGAIRDRAAQYAAIPMTILDAFAAEAGWNAGYSYGKRALKLSEAQAITFADDIVARTQGVGIRGAVSPIQASAATKWMTLFQTFAINDFNYIARDLLGIRHPDRKNSKHVRKVIKYTAASVLANMAFEAMGEQAPKPSPFTTYNEVIGDGGTEGEAMTDAILEMTEFIPMIGGSMKYGSNLFGAFAEWGEKVPESLRALIALPLDWSGMSPKERFNNALLIGETTGKTFGVPMTNQLKKQIRTASRTDDPVKVILGIYVKEVEGTPFINLEQRSRSARSTRSTRSTRATR